MSRVCYYDCDCCGLSSGPHENCSRLPILRTYPHISSVSYAALERSYGLSWCAVPIVTNLSLQPCSCTVDGLLYCECSHQGAQRIIIPTPTYNPCEVPFIGVPQGSFLDDPTPRTRHQDKKITYHRSDVAPRGFRRILGTATIQNSRSLRVLEGHPCPPSCKQSVFPKTDVYNDLLQAWQSKYNLTTNDDYRDVTTIVASIASPPASNPNYRLLSNAGFQPVICRLTELYDALHRKQANVPPMLVQQIWKEISSLTIYHKLRSQASTGIKILKFTLRRSHGKLFTQFWESFTAYSLNTEEWDDNFRMRAIRQKKMRTTQIVLSQIRARSLQASDPAAAEEQEELAQAQAYFESLNSKLASDGSLPKLSAKQRIQIDQLLRDEPAVPQGMADFLSGIVSALCSVEMMGTGFTLAAIIFGLLATHYEAPTKGLFASISMMCYGAGIGAAVGSMMMNYQTYIGMAESCIFQMKKLGYCLLRKMKELLPSVFGDPGLELINIDELPPMPTPSDFICYYRENNSNYAKVTDEMPPLPLRAQTYVSLKAAFSTLPTAFPTGGKFVLWRHIAEQIRLRTPWAHQHGYAIYLYACWVTFGLESVLSLSRKDGRPVIEIADSDRDHIESYINFIGMTPTAPYNLLEPENVAPEHWVEMVPLDTDYPPLRAEDASPDYLHSQSDFRPQQDAPRHKKPRHKSNNDDTCPRIVPLATSSNAPPGTPQGFAFLDDWLNVLKTFTHVIGASLSPAAWKTRLSTFSSIWKGVKDIAEVWRWILPLMVTTVNALSTRVTGHSIWINDSVALQKLVVVDTLTATQLSTELVAGAEPRALLPRFSALATRRSEMELLVAKLDPEDANAKRFDEYAKRFNALFKQLRSRDAALHPRVLPLCVSSFGDGGVGKTKFMKFLSKALHHTGHLRNDGVAMIDNDRNFQDGVTTEATWFRDEFCTINSAVARETDVRFLFKNINTTPELVEKAAVDEKSLYWVENQLLLLTSNIELTEIGRLVPKAEALHRRLHVQLTIHPPARQANGDFPQRNGEIDWSQFTFTISQPDAANAYSPKVTHERVPVTDVILLCAQKLVERAADHGADAREDLADYLDADFLAKLPPPIIPRHFVPVQAARDAILESPGQPQSPSEGASPPHPIVKWLTCNPRVTAHTQFLTWSEVYEMYIAERQPPRDMWVIEVNAQTTDEAHAYADALQCDLVNCVGPVGVDPFTYAMRKHRIHTRIIDSIKSGATTAYAKFHTSFSDGFRSLISGATSKFSNAKDGLYERLSSWTRKAKNTFVSAVTTFLLKDSLEPFRKFLYWFTVALSIVFLALMHYAIAKLVNLTTSAATTAYTSVKNWWTQDAPGDTQNSNERRRRYKEEKHDYQDTVAAGNDRGANHPKYKYFDPSDKSRIAHMNRVNTFKGGRGTPQAPADYASLVESAAVYIGLSNGKNLRAIGLFGRIVIMPHHYLYMLGNYEEGLISTAVHARHIKFDTLKFYSWVENDVCAFELPPQYPLFRNILERFVKQDEISRITGRVTLWLTQKDARTREITDAVPREPRMMRWHNPDPEETSLYTSLCYVFQMPTQAGDCGSLYTCDVPTFGPRTIIGFHCAGLYENAFANLLSQEFLCHVYDTIYPDAVVAPKIMLPSEVGEPQMPLGTKKEFEVPDRDHTYVNLHLPFADGYQPEDGLRDANLAKLQTDLTTGDKPSLPRPATLVGQVTKPVHISRKHRLERSCISHNLPEPPTTELCVLSRNESVTGEDPLDVFHAKLVRPTISPFDESIMRQCADSTLYYVTKHPHRGVIPLYDAIYGFGVIRSMDHTASAGYPWNEYATEMKKPCNKGTWIGTRDDPQPHPRFIAACEESYATLLDGKIPDYVYTEQLKEEALSPAKVATSSTRGYFAQCIVGVANGRQLFGAFIDAILVNRPKNPGKVSTSVGISADEYTITAAYKATQNGDAKAGDQAGFDRHQAWVIAKILGDAINAWYPTKEDPRIKRARILYLYSVYHALILCGSNVYSLDFLMVSGCFLTSFINSMYLESCTLKVLWKILARRTDELKAPRLSPLDIKKSMFALYYGDDSYIVLPKEWKISSMEMFAEYGLLGLEATHCIKTWPLDQEIPAEKLTYLQRELTLNEDNVLTWRLPKSTIEDMIHWVKRKDVRNPFILRSTARNMLIEARRHGLNYFKQIYENLEAAFTACSIPLDLSPHPGEYCSNRL